VLGLENEIPFDPVSAEDFFRQLPARPGVCAIEPRTADAQPFLIRTQNLKNRLQRMLGPDDPSSKRLNLREFARAVRFRITGSRLEQTITFYQNAKHLHPDRYRDLLRMRPPAVLKVNLKNAYPRCFVTRRIPTNAEGVPIAGSYYGPFKKRKVAERFAEGVLDFFKVRRCQIKIRRDPTFPGCLYSEMKMCLAPCFAGCSKEEYGAEVQKLINFLDTGGNSLREALEKEREQASEDLDFEKANVLHKRLEKLDGALRSGPELARKVSDIDAVILQRASEDQTIAAFAVRHGFLDEDPLIVRFAEMATNPKSAEQLFRDYLERSITADTSAGSHVGARLYPEEQGNAGLTADATPLTNPTIAGVVGARHAVPAVDATPSTKPPIGKFDLSEHLWLLARWYYSNDREGEIFFHTESDRQPGWPYRRILRACSRLLAPEPPPSTEPINETLSVPPTPTESTPAQNEAKIIKPEFLKPRKMAKHKPSTQPTPFNDSSKEPPSNDGSPNDGSPNEGAT
jgi:excinuclease ABC subunit C